MNLIPTVINEIGGFTTISILSSRYRGEASSLSPVEDSLARYLPINPSLLDAHDCDYSTIVVEKINSIEGIRNKKQLIIAGAELMLLEAIACLKLDSKVYQVVDDRLPQSSLKRMRANIPTGLAGKVCSIPAIPAGLTPTNTLLLVSGFWGGGNLVLLPESVRAVLLFLQNIYFGEILLVVPFSEAIRARPEGWVTVNFSNFFTGVAGISKAKHDSPKQAPQNPA